MTHLFPAVNPFRKSDLSQQKNIYYYAKLSCNLSFYCSLDYLMNRVSRASKSDLIQEKMSLTEPVTTHRHAAGEEELQTGTLLHYIGSQAKTVVMHLEE